MTQPRASVASPGGHPTPHSDSLSGVGPKSELHMANQPGALPPHPPYMARGPTESHEVIVTPFTQDGTTLYELTVRAGNQSEHHTYATLESAMDSFDPPLSARVRSHIVEGVHGEGKPVVFCLEDSFEKQ